ncbi:hypothetical protein BVRB_5g115920 [Beta vulgaris subsp. vulgaris]|nr:hypothetical protein BVRB_5g115920 [Beta vulgaris subsp. vulgaris]
MVIKLVEFDVCRDLFSDHFRNFLKINIYLHYFVHTIQSCLASVVHFYK